MEDIFERLATDLLYVNDQLSYHQARTWVEVLWEDFETTQARAGRGYKGKEVSEHVVREWIRQYGPALHEFKTGNPRFSHLFEDRGLKH